MNSDFLSYWVSCAVTAHFKSGKYNILNGLPHKQKFTEKWNQERFDSDGKLYHLLGDKFKTEEKLIRLYSIYYYQFGSSYPAKIIEDNFSTYEKFMDELKHIDITYQLDLKKIRKYCEINEIGIKELLTSSKILSAKVSVFTLIILNEIFKLTDKIEAETTFEKKFVEGKKLRLDKIGIIFHNELKGDWKKITRKILLGV